MVLAKMVQAPMALALMALVDTVVGLAETRMVLVRTIIQTARNKTALLGRAVFQATRVLARRMMVLVSRVGDLGKVALEWVVQTWVVPVLGILVLETKLAVLVDRVLSAMKIVIYQKKRL